MWGSRLREAGASDRTSHSPDDHAVRSPGSTRKRKRLHPVLHLAAHFLGATVVTIAQGCGSSDTMPTSIRTSGDDPILTQAPRLVEAYDDGTFVLVLQDVATVSRRDAPAVLPSQVNVVSINLDGTVTPGVRYRNSTGQTLYAYQALIPEVICMDSAGNYELRLIGAYCQSRAGLEHGCSALVPGTESVPVVYRTLAPVPRGGDDHD